MRIVEVTENKKQYLDLLLLADEQEDMVDRYLYNGKMYVLDDDGVKCECVVTDEGNGILEIKNIATVPPFQRKGYAKALIATVYKGNIIKNLIMDCQSYTKYRPNETTGGIFVSWRRKEELPTGA